MSFNEILIFNYNEDRLDLVWGPCFWSIILWYCPPVIDIILKVATTDELLYLVFKGDELLGGVTNVFMEPAVLILVPFGVVST